MTGEVVRVIVDTHLHVYPWYDLGKVFRSLTENLAALDGTARRGAVLTERTDCTLFADLRDGRVVLPVPWKICATGEDESLVVDGEELGSIFLFAGRQIVSAERIEILSLLADPRGLDGRPAEDIVAAVASAGGVPVLAWAPGKWLFRRGEVVRELTARFGAGEILLGDTTLRPTRWAEPRLMAVAQKKGIAVVAGSDPLPITSEEHYAGSFATLFAGAFDPSRPACSLRRLLTDPATVRLITGRRCGLIEAVERLYRNGRAKR